jgi:tetratricopeptide (TPR) repeat protein
MMVTLVTRAGNACCWFTKPFKTRNARVTKFLLVVAGIALSTNAAVVAVLIAVLVGFSDTAGAEDEGCSKLFKSDYLRELCSDVRPKMNRRSDIERYVRMQCGILKIGHENPSPSFPRSSKVIADAERAVQECINQYPDLGPLQPAPTQPTPSAYTRGLAALDEGNFDAAIAEFTAAIADDPKDTFSYIRRGTAYEKKGDAASAIGDYRKVLNLVDADTGAEYAAKIRKLEKTKK